jgi:GDPmannose 4,6-dehydratase
LAKIALITGISGQDGSYLAELLLSKGYEVHGIIRRSSSFNTGRIDHIFNKIHLHYCDLSDGLNIFDVIHDVEPGEVYHLGAQSHVKVSFNSPVYTVDINATGTIRMLEAIRKINPEIRFYNAASSEMYGKVQEVPQTEITPFYPRSPYGCTKLFSYYATINYRESYDIHASNGVLFNHESPRRGGTFVTQKIVKGLVDIMLDRRDELVLGNLDAKRDWGHSRDYVRAMWLMLQQDKPGDYVIATGMSISVRQFIEKTIVYLEEHYDVRDLYSKIRTDKKYFRPSEVDELLGDASKAKRVLGWEPEISLDDMIAEMVQEAVCD